MTDQQQEKPPKPKSLIIIGRRWFQKTYGNTYHTAEIIADGQTVHKTVKSYGYGDCYTQTAHKWLIKSGYLPPTGESHYVSLWRECEKAGISLSYRAIDVGREKDL